MKKLKGLKHLSLQDSSRLTTTMQGGPWTAEQRSSLAEAVASLSETVSVKTDRCQQTCLSFASTLTDPAWDALFGRSLIHSKVSLLGAHGWSIGLTCPNELTQLAMGEVLTYCLRSTGIPVEPIQVRQYAK